MKNVKTELVVLYDHCDLCCDGAWIDAARRAALLCTLEPDIAGLSSAASVLERMDYRVVGFLDQLLTMMTRVCSFLHVEKEELHTVASLDARNHELYRFAEEFGVESYDGVDVGPIDDPL